MVFSGIIEMPFLNSKISSLFKNIFSTQSWHSRRWFNVVSREEQHSLSVYCYLSFVVLSSLITLIMKMITRMVRTLIMRRGAIQGGEVLLRWRRLVNRRCRNIIETDEVERAISAMVLFAYFWILCGEFMFKCMRIHLKLIIYTYTCTYVGCSLTLLFIINIKILFSK